MWEQIKINKTQIEHETSKAVLVKCPAGSDYPGYVFWHPLKLLRDNRLSYNESFDFKLQKYSKDKQLIDTVIINAEEFTEMFANQAIEKGYLITEEPEKINIDIKVPKCLKNNN